MEAILDVTSFAGTHVRCSAVSIRAFIITDWFTFEMGVRFAGPTGATNLDFAKAGSRLKVNKFISRYRNCYLLNILLHIE